MPSQTHTCDDSCACSQSVAIETDYKAPRLPYVYIGRLAAAGILTAVCAFASLPDLAIRVGYLAAYVLAGYEILTRAVKNAMRGKFFDENFLMTVASLGALALGDFEEAVTVLIFFGVGETLQNNAIAKSKQSIAELMDIKPEVAHVVSENGTREMRPEEVSIGAHVQVRPGGKVPLDGCIISGSSYVDTRTLTGESVAKLVEVGDEVLAGYVNGDTTLVVRVTANYAQSATAKMLDLVSNASNKKALTEQFITRFSKVYTPSVLAIAAVVAIIPPLITGEPFGTWVYRALVFLVISCPCALVISIPLSFFGGIGAASKHGILIKGGNYLEVLARVKTMVLDKTGTLTQGNFVVTQCCPVGSFSENELLEAAASAEGHSSHPIGLSIRRYAADKGVVAIEPSSVTEHAGFGVTAQVGGSEIIVGSLAYLAKCGVIKVPDITINAIFIARSGIYCGYLVIEDEIRPGTTAALQALRHEGVEKLYMLTGDGAEVASYVADQVGIDHTYAELMPADKVAKIEEILDGTPVPAKVGAVGDGINDAPVLSRADVGIAMGGIGSDATIEAADVVIMNDDVSKLATAIRIGKKTRTIVMQNIIFALSVKVAIMVLAVVGITSIWFAIFADVGVALIALANALRASRV